MRSRLRSRAAAWPAGASFATEAAEEPKMPVDCLPPMLGVRA